MLFIYLLLFLSSLDLFMKARTAWLELRLARIALRRTMHRASLAWRQLKLDRFDGLLPPSFQGKWLDWLVRLRIGSVYRISLLLILQILPSRLLFPRRCCTHIFYLFSYLTLFKRDWLAS